LKDQTTSKQKLIVVGGGLIPPLAILAITLVLLANEGASILSYVAIMAIWLTIVIIASWVSLRMVKNMFQSPE
jgi:hypothetical protein